nr:hypothetical protein [Tanacetum cinerariifolium]
MDQNIDSSGFDQIQTPQYPIIHQSSREISEENFQAKGDLMKSIRTFLEKFNRYPFGVMPKISQAWEKFFEIQHAQPEDTNKLFQKLLEDLQIIKEELAEYINSPSWNYHTFYDDDEEHYVQYKEYLENSSDAIAPILSTKEPEYSLSIGEYEVTSEDKRECDVLVYEDSSTFDICDDHSKILSGSNNDDISSDDDAFEDIEYVEASPLDPELVSLEENDVHQEKEEEVDLEDIFQIQDVVLREKLLSINHLIANIESLNDNPTPDCVLKPSASFPIFEESGNSLSDNFSPEFETFSDHTKETRSGNTTTHAHDYLPEYDSFCFEIEPDQERLTSVVKNDISYDSSNDPLLEEIDLFLAFDNSIPPDLLPRLLDDSRTIEKAANMAIQQEKEEQVDDEEERLSEIKQAFTDEQYQPEEIRELMSKLFKDVQNIRVELAEYINSLNWNSPTFYDNDEEYSILYKEYLENSSNAITPILPTKEPEYSLIIGDDDAFEDIEYVKASPPNSELVSLEEENDVYQEDEEFNLEDILQIQDVILREKLLSINCLIADIESLNDNPTSDCVLKSSASFHIFKKSDNSLSNNSSLEFETFSDHTEETRSEVNLFLASDNLIPPGIEDFGYNSEGDIYFLEELLVDDSISFPENDLSNFDYQDDPLFPRPPPEPPDVEFFFDFKPNSGKVISVVMNNIDELNKDEYFDLGGEINGFANVEDDDYFPFIFVI